MKSRETHHFLRWLVVIGAGYSLAAAVKRAQSNGPLLQGISVSQHHGASHRWKLRDWHTVDGPAKSEAPAENGGKHPIIYRVLVLTIQGDAGFRNHPQYGGSARSPSHPSLW